MAGEALAISRGCSQCHSSEAGLLAGSSNGIGGAVYGPNITPDPDTGIGGWTDEQIIRALRFGVDDEGVPLCSQMPREPSLSDTDAANLVAYLRSIPLVNHVAPESECTPDEADLAVAGRFVVEDLGCASCHGADLGGVDRAISGSQAFAPNLTPDRDTGLGAWTADQLITAIQTGVDDEGETLCEVMPRYPDLEDAQVHAIVAYLQSLPPVQRSVSESECERSEPEDAGGHGESEDAGVTPATDAGTNAGTDAGTDAGTVAGMDAGVDAGTDAGLDAGTDAGVSTCTGAPVVISEVYGGGGNSGALLRNDFVELHNRTNHAVDLGGWALQYASAAGTSWSVAGIPSGTTINPGAFIVFALASSGTNGAALPSTAVALTPALNLSSSTGKVALTHDTTALTTACPLPGTTIEDFVGFGTSATCAEGSMATASLSATTAALRIDTTSLACGDTGVNATDFVVATAAPHQGTSLCGCP